MTDQENIQIQKNLFDIYSGILFNNQEFAPGETAEITYDFSCSEYKTLIEKYGIDKIAGEGTAFERSVRLLHWMAPRLTHKGDYDNHVPVNALDLLEYSLDNPEQGINCVNKAKILAECCLAVGIYARRVYIMPYSPYDGDNHVVTEIYDGAMGKWIMVDPTVDGYFTDEKGRPLSVLELRERFAHQKFAALLTGKDSADDLSVLPEKHMDLLAYFCKNLFRIGVDLHSGFGDGDKEALWLIPAGYETKKVILANIAYRMRRWPAGKEALEKWRGQVEARPEPVPRAPSLLTAPPQYSQRT